MVLTTFITTLQILMLQIGQKALCLSLPQAKMYCPNPTRAKRFEISDHQHDFSDVSPVLLVNSLALITSCHKSITERRIYTNIYNNMVYQSAKKHLDRLPQPRIKNRQTKKQLTAATNSRSGHHSSQRTVVSYLRMIYPMQSRATGNNVPR